MATGIVDYLLKTGRAKLQTHKCYDFLEVARPDFDLVAVEKILDKFHFSIARMNDFYFAIDFGRPRHT